MKVGKFELTPLRLVDTRLAFLAGVGDYRARFELGRIQSREGWKVTTSEVRVWKMLPYGINNSIREIWQHEWVH